MMRTSLLAATALASLTLALTPAQALSSRAWVSGHGTDAGSCGAPTNPCRSFQYVHDNIIAAGGEIDVLDPAGYGAVTITKALSIVNDGVGEAGVSASSGNGITVSTVANDVVNLRGLTLAGLSGSGEGILFNAAGTLNIQNCVVRGFGGDGIGLEPTGSATFNIIDTIVSNVANNAIGIQTAGTGTVKAVFNRTQAIGSSAGFIINGANSSGAVNVTIANSASNNNSYGVTTEGSTSRAITQVTVVNSVVANNGTGIFEDGPNSTTFLAKNTIAGNTTAFNVLNSGALFSFGDNDVRGNGNDGGTISLVSTK